MRAIQKVRAALLRQYGRDDKGEARVDIVRNLRGGSYYYFIGELGLDRVPTLYQYSLDAVDVPRVLDHVKEALS
jgi:hypothetical protein